jgi:hypothetical protein
MSAAEHDSSAGDSELLLLAFCEPSLVVSPHASWWLLLPGLLDNHLHVDLGFIHH